MAVIGVGAMGRNHARIYREMRETELLAVADANVEAATTVADYFGTRAYSDYRQMLEVERPAAVTIAVPTQMHHRVVLDALQAGCHVLVEKPIAASLEEARDLIAAAKSAGRILTVGHIERYNPAITELKRRLEGGEAGCVFQLHTRRLGPFPARVRDVGVVLDLATHDLDIMLYLVNSPLVRLFAETRRNIHTSNEDLLTGTIVFEGGAVGLLEINWLTPTKIRELYITAERGMFLANYLTQDLYFYENAEINGRPWSSLAVLRGVTEGEMVRFAIPKREPLLVEQESFLAAIRGEPVEIVTGEQGLAVLSLALSVVQSGTEHRVIHLDSDGQLRYPSMLLANTQT